MLLVNWVVHYLQSLFQWKHQVPGVRFSPCALLLPFDFAAVHYVLTRNKQTNSLMETVTITGRCFCLSLMVQLSPEYPPSFSVSYLSTQMWQSNGMQAWDKDQFSIYSVTHTCSDKCLALQQKVPVSRPCVLNLLCLSCHESRNKMEDGCFPGVHPLKGKLFFNICFWWKSIKTLMKQYCWGHAVVDEVGKGSCYTFFFWPVHSASVIYEFEDTGCYLFPMFFFLVLYVRSCQFLCLAPTISIFFSLMTKWWDSPPDST